MQNIYVDVVLYFILTGLWQEIVANTTRTSVLNSMEIKFDILQNFSNLSQGQAILFDQVYKTDQKTLA